MESVVSDFWHGKRVFLTGHTGFKGSWLAMWLHRLGASVVGYSLPPPTEPNLFSLARVRDIVESRVGDVRDLEAMSRVLRTSRAEIVFHLAAQPLVGAGYVDPVHTFGTNVMGTVNLLQAIRSVDTVRAVVNVTTDKCYRNDDSGKAFAEYDALGGTEPYGASKACSEIATEAFGRAFFNPASHAAHGAALATARAGNVIGGGDWGQRRLIPDVVQCLQAGEPAVVRRPESTRPWQHVLDPLNGYMRLARHLFEHGSGYQDAWNFGPTGAELMSVAQIADRCVQLWGGNESWRNDDRVHPPEAKVLRLDSKKAQRELGWVPRISIDEALKMTIEWYRAVAADTSLARQLCEAQIAAYRDKETG